MPKRRVQAKRRCPGETYDINRSICKGRQRVHYPKCPVCRYRVEHTSDTYEVYDENEIEETENSDERSFIQLTSNQDQQIDLGIFKSYDIRGVYPEELNEHTSEKIGMATVQFLKSIKDGVENIVVGRDGRLSSNVLAKSLMKGIQEAGVNCIDIGEVSTDVTYFSVGHYNYDAGITVTASHNPSEYNGFKICHEKAMPISFDTGLAKISEISRQTRLAATGQSGKIIEKNILDEYKKHVLSFAGRIRPLKIVVDAGNGMAGKMVPLVFEDLPCKIVPLYFNIDGNFPHHDPDPLNKKNLQDLQKKVRTTKSHLGVAFDGDADRCVFVDENGQVIGCDLITAVIAKEFLKKERGAAIVYDLRSSRVLPEEIKESGGIPCREKVGHSHIKITMRERNALFGGELSGHYYFRDNYFADSGIIALLTVLNILSNKNVPMSNLIAPLKRYYATGEVNFKVEDKEKKIAEIAEHFKEGKIDYVDGVTVQFKDWWFNVRKSNTEPFLRLNLEGKTKALMEKRQKQIIDIIQGD
ncbi:MAG: phosphomannomutase/phosphoglucomutase [Candidatus Scalindua sp. AMX11]|nr:MAG: phosphomannomutase/phosphoglucomutase [Candidatus Scalindua sp.]NOG83856.1 phosphomannomutase/phosphoglucomutase [Planctomycetota bacterium]RZV83005.1 MAG: phosphomannomutase/phosphoglucomutase [Candidatus Scalindua sp. SCAELEC01]TDE64509.1 MAG: phosphomannomutase/phosphoglucomutase [Candidatus Scalindua sp. AMX11]GJQ58751.1 MAG: phosphomannomutase [Candidatus Scalindua sp.]